MFFKIILYLQQYYSIFIYWTRFWSHTYTFWEQIKSSSPLGETCTHGLNLDWKRFVTHQTVELIL